MQYKNSTETETNLGPHPKYFGNRIVQIHTETLHKQIHHIYLNNEIHDANAYSEFLDILNNATEIDEIHVHINNWGGEGYTMLQIINSMQSCQGYIITYAEGAVASASTFIFLQGHELRVSNYVKFMVHAPTLGHFEKYQGLLDAIDSDKKFWKEISYDIYGHGFMSNKEIKEMLNGKDFWFDKTELRARLEKRQARMKKEMESLQK